MTSIYKNNRLIASNVLSDSIYIIIEMVYNRNSI